jgi:hypothetical protein
MNNNYQAMQKFSSLILVFTCIAAVLIAGCTSSQPPAATPTVTPTAVPLTTPLVTTSQPIVSSSTAPIAVSTTLAATTPAASDPILHRWIWQAGDPTASTSVGYEFKFYPDGTVDYRAGSTKQESSNIIIDTSQNFTEYSGTWTAMGNDTYMVKVLPTGLNGASIIRVYTLVPAHIDPKFPGVTDPAQIQSSYEAAEIGAGPNQEHPNSNLMYYPTQALID